MESAAHNSGDPGGDSHAFDGHFVRQRECLFERRRGLERDYVCRSERFVACAGLSWEDCSVGNEGDVAFLSVRSHVGDTFFDDLISQGI